MSNILERANEIANKRSEEKERQYGPMEETHRRTAELCSLLTGKEITTTDIYWMKVAMKLAREAHSHKEDNLVDACAYLSGLNDWQEKLDAERRSMLASTGIFGNQENL